MVSPFLRLYLIFFVLSALWIVSMFYRVSNAVIATNLIQDLGLDPESLGSLGGAYFYSLALLQIPMGPMLDRIGPRILVTFFPLIGALGSFIFRVWRVIYRSSFWKDPDRSRDGPRIDGGFQSVYG